MKEHSKRGYRMSLAETYGLETVCIVLLQFLLYHCAACLALSTFNGAERAEQYVEMLFLLAPLVCLRLVRAWVKKFWLYFLLHLPVLFTAVFLGQGFGQKAVIAVCTILMTSVSLYTCMSEKGAVRDCPSIWPGAVLLACHFLAAYLQYPALVKISYFEILLFGILWLVCAYLKNTADFIRLHQDMANFPGGQLTVIGRSMMALLLLAVAAAMFIVPRLHLEVILRPVLQGILFVLSRLLSYIKLPEGNSGTRMPVGGATIEQLREALKSDDGASPFWLMIEDMLVALLIAGIALTVIGGAAWLLFRLYKGFYAGKRENADEKEFLLGEVKWPGRQRRSRETGAWETGSCSRQIRKSYKKFVRKSFGRKRSVPESMTPEELLAYLEREGHELNEQTREQIRELYEKARYGQTESVQEELEAIRKLLAGARRRK